MILEKLMGSYAKQLQRTGTRGCEPLDRDLMALDEEVWRSNLGRGFEIGWPQAVRGAAAALAAPAASLAAAACRSSSKSTLRGSNREGIWPGTVSAIRVNHLSPERGTGVRGAELATAVAALGAGNPPECGVPATGVA